jgi:hypothetical protein
MPGLTLRFKKKSDGTAALSCTRADGSVTWQRQEGSHALFFPRHDLTHYAVETVLGHRRGFYGLIAEGWDFGDFGAPWPRGPLPADMDPSELIVGFLDGDRLGGLDWTAAQLSDEATRFCEAHGLKAAPPALTQDQLDRIRERRRQLFEKWDALAPGEALQLSFPPDAD